MTYEQRYGSRPPEGADRDRWRDRKVVWIKAQIEEREACAKLCENIGGVTGETLADRIRARRTP